MKLFICLCLLVLAIGPCVNAKSFDFGTFFLGSSKKALDGNSNIPPAVPEPNLFESDPADYSTEVDTEGFNSSSDDIFDFQNSSSDSLEVSGRDEAENITAISDNLTASVATEAEVQNNETHSTEKNEVMPPVSSTVTSEKTTTLTEAPLTANLSKESQNTVAAEEEKVVLGTTTGATIIVIPKTFFQKSIDWVEDAYTLSILIPITAGILFATTIIIMVALCRCLRRCCRRRRFKRKPLPDSVKNLRPSDRARLLGDTSDEEF